MTTERAQASRYTPHGAYQRLRRILHRPADFPLFLRVGWFLLLLPSRLDRVPLPRLLDEISRAGRPRALNVAQGLNRLVRLRHPWLSRPLADRNTCYVRALCMYRFLDPGAKQSMRIHFGVEPGIDSTDRVRGHAWVTVDGELLEAPEPVLAGRVREIYAHPPVRGR